MNVIIEELKTYKLIRYGNRIVGKIINNQFHKWCNQKHIYRKNFGIAISKEIITTLKEKGITEIIINYNDTDTGSKSTYATTTTQYDMRGKIIIDGHGRFKDEQICLPVKHMKLKKGIQIVKQDPQQRTLGIYK